MHSYKLITGLSEEKLKEIPDNSIDAVVTDPPYGLGNEPDIAECMKDWIEKGFHETKNKSGFMGKSWDAFVPQPILWKEVFRVLKPGGHILCACGTRTQDLMCMGLRFAGFEIRDVITYHYASGFPKSMNISKQIDRMAGAERTKIGVGKAGSGFNEVKGFGINTTQGGKATSEWDITEPATDEAKQWNGFGTSLKPATEFWTLARKPISEKSVAENILKWGTGGLNIDGCRIGETGSRNNGCKPSEDGYGKRELYGKYKPVEKIDYNSGRFPANVVFDEYMAEELDRQSGISTSGTVGPDGFKGEYKANVYGKYGNNIIDPDSVYGDTGGASRFFFVSKTSTEERNAGLRNFTGGTIKDNRNINLDNPYHRGETIKKNIHPTVKPITLMRYLVKLITPPGGTVLDPFNGSGSTGCGCMMEAFNYVGIDSVTEYIEISEARIQYWFRQYQNEHAQLELPFT